MRYGSVCSGIEAATVAWHSLGWEPAFFSEIDKFPREVLAHHYPDDYTRIREKCPDGPRYKALGNSMAVPVMRWIGERIQQAEAI